MKTYLIMAMLWLTASSCYAQIQFESGYFIDNGGRKTECLIRNSDWKNNPDRFRYKLSEDGEVHVLEIGMVQEFSIPGKIKFVRHTVDIDRRSYLTKDLSVVRDPVFKTESVFLKILVEGQADLSSYEDGNLVRYFYAFEEGPPVQLVYTRYKSQENRILENFYYKSQLSEKLKCGDISSSVINNVSYTETDLVNYFERYNACSGGDFTTYEDDDDRKLFYFNARPGIESSSITTSYFQSNVPRTDYGNQVSLRIGAELEMILPFNKNKWGITFEPFYHSYKSESDNDTSADYSSLVTAFGLRHYFFLNENSKIFINGNFGLEFPFTARFRVATSSTRRDLEVARNMLDNYWAIGGGYNFNNKYSLELRYMFNQDILEEYEFWTADWSGVSLILGINLF